jgi:hypothetical protein
MIANRIARPAAVSNPVVPNLKSLSPTSSAKSQVVIAVAQGDSLSFWLRVFATVR